MYYLIPQFLLLFPAAILILSPLPNNVIGTLPEEGSLTFREDQGVYVNRNRKFVPIVKSQPNVFKHWLYLHGQMNNVSQAYYASR